MKKAKNVLLRIGISALLVLFTATVFQSCGKKKNEGALSEISAKTILADTDFSEKYADSFDSQNVAPFYERRTKMTSIVSVNDLNLPETLTAKGTDQEFGLYIYNGTSFVRYSEADASAIDPNKKTLIHAHGMGFNGNWNNYKGYYENGYNVLCLHWGAFASEEYYAFRDICDKIWTYDSPMRYRNADANGWVSGEDIQYSMAEIYAAYYLDFLNKFPSCMEKELILTGHSYGGMLTTALLSYLTTAFANGLVEVKYLPDRAVLCDPFFVDGTETYKVRWLGDTPNDYYGGSIFLSKQALIAAHTVGISVALVRSSGLITTSFAMAYKIPDITPALDTLNINALYVDGNALPLFNFNPDKAHVYGEVWPAAMTKEVYDTSCPSEYAFSAFNPYHADFARVGTTYDLDYKDTSTDFTDDTITLHDKTKGTKIYGFAFVDENGNGQLDERLGSHVKGVTVTLTDASGNVQTVTTGLNGYYEFTSSGACTLTFSAPKGYDPIQKEIRVEPSENALFLYAPSPLKKSK